MVMNLLRFLTWNALVLMRFPLRGFFSAMVFLSLMLVIIGVVALPFGGVGDTPLWAQLTVILAMAALFALWSALAFYYDTLIFNLTPWDREIILSD